jgi:FkbH-like protein
VSEARARAITTAASDDCLARANACFREGDLSGAYAWVVKVAEPGESFRAWASAAAALARFAASSPPSARRSARIALAGSYTTSQLAPLLRLAGLRRGLDLEVFETGFDTYRQEILDPGSDLYEFAPDYVILAPHEGGVPFPPLTEDVEGALEAELARWRSLWDAIEERTSARVVQHNFAVRPETAWGHVGLRLPGTRDAMLRALNARLAEEAGDGVLLVDCDGIASSFGKHRWFDDRYWHLSKQAVALDALPELARHTAAVLAGAEGLSAKCIVLDLDNTLWGGVIAEDGLAGIELGGGPRGEAYVAFQEYLLALRARGILLAVASKNNDGDAREPFERHPDMRLALDHFSVFVANWDDKPRSLQTIAAELNIGLDSLVFVDDNPAEREVVRQLLPEVEVLELPADPSGYVRALSSSLLFEAPSITAEDLGRAAQYRGRAATAVLQERAGSLEDFYESLEMEAFVAPFDELNLARIAQLVAKTNQFNLTTRRHSLNDLRSFMADDGYITLYLRLRDQFVDHGLVGVLIARDDGETIDIDTWLMSCRVIGRTVEDEMLMQLCEAARARGRSRVRGTFVPTEKNAVVRDLFEQLGFSRVSEDGGASFWEYDIDKRGMVTSDFIRSVPEPVAGA